MARKLEQWLIPIFVNSKKIRANKHRIILGTFYHSYDGKLLLVACTHGSLKAKTATELWLVIISEFIRKPFNHY